MSMIKKSLDNDSVTRSGVKASKRGQQGAVWALMLILMIGFFTVLALVFNIYLIFREDREQERIARSAAVVALKSYVRAGPQFHEKKRITYALEAASKVLNVEVGSADPIGQFTMPSESRQQFEESVAMPNTPVTIKLSDSLEGDTASEAVITLGAATRYIDAAGASTYSLKPFSLQDPYIAVPSRAQIDRIVGARVSIEGLSQTSRKTLLPQLLGFHELFRKKSEIMVVFDYDVAEEAQPLQVPEVEISTSPPVFNPPAGINPSVVSYTMSMDLVISDTGPSWRSVFNSGDIDYVPGVFSRCPALFISGTDNPPANRLYIVHCTSDDINRHEGTSFLAAHGVPFNITWTVANGALKTYINGALDPTGSFTGSFRWAEQLWRWNAYLAQHPTRSANVAGSVKVKNVYWWNRALSEGEVRSIETISKGKDISSEYKFVDCTKWHEISRSECSASCGGGTQVVTERFGCGDAGSPTRNRSVPCNTRQCASCQFGGREFSHGEAGIFYTRSSVACGESCSAFEEARRCIDGTMSGSATLASCTPTICRDCSLDGQTVPHNTSRTFFSAASVSCTNECSGVGGTRTCFNGNLSGSASFNKASCTKNACRSCSAGGVVVNHGQSGTFYASSSVGCGSTCSSELRGCNDGALSGSFTNTSCSVGACCSGQNTLYCPNPTTDNQAINQGCWANKIIATYGQWNVNDNRGRCQNKNTEISYKYFDSCNNYVGESARFVVQTTCN